VKLTNKWTNRRSWQDTVPGARWTYIILALKVTLNSALSFSVMFHSTNGNDFRSETGSSTASLLCGSTVGSPSDSLASCLVMLPCLVISSQSGLNSSYAAFQYSASKICSHLPIILCALILVKSFAPYTDLYVLTRSRHPSISLVWTRLGRCVRVWCLRSDDSTPPWLHGRLEIAVAGGGATESQYWCRDIWPLAGLPQVLRASHDWQCCNGSSVYLHRTQPQGE